MRFLKSDTIFRWKVNAIGFLVINLRLVAIAISTVLAIRFLKAIQKLHYIGSY